MVLWASKTLVHLSTLLQSSNVQCHFGWPPVAFGTKSHKPLTNIRRSYCLPSTKIVLATMKSRSFGCDIASRPYKHHRWGWAHPHRECHPIAQHHLNRIIENRRSQRHHQMAQRRCVQAQGRVSRGARQCPLIEHQHVHEVERGKLFDDSHSPHNHKSHLDTPHSANQVQPGPCDEAGWQVQDVAYLNGCRC